MNKPFNTIYSQAIIDMFPLSIAIIPWGVLCGSMAVQAGLSSTQAQCMSLFIFAGAAQLAAINIMGSLGSLLSIISSTAVISSRHLLYSASFSKIVKQLPFTKRAAIAFLLTDEMFVVVEAQKKKQGYFDPNYAITAGFTFYLFWNIATFLGIYLGELANVAEMGFEFAIAAIFIAMVIPQIKSYPVLISVLTSGISILTLNKVGFEHSLIVATIIGMLSGYIAQNRH